MKWRACIGEPKLCLERVEPALATTKTNNTKFIDWPACQLRQYFPSIWLGWPNTTFLKFIKHSVIPADLREDLIIWYIELYPKLVHYADSENWTTSSLCFKIHTAAKCHFWKGVLSPSSVVLVCPKVQNSPRLIWGLVIWNGHGADSLSARNSI